MTSPFTLTTWLAGLEAPQLGRVLALRNDISAPPEPHSLEELAVRLLRPGSVALALPQLPLPCLQVAEVLAALGTPLPRDVLARTLGVTAPAATRELDAVLGTLADHGLVWPDGDGKLHLAAPLRQAWDAPLGLDAPLEVLLEGMTSEELRRLLVTLGIKPPGTRQQRTAALREHHRDPERIASVVAKAPSCARELLEHRARSAPQHTEFIVFGAPQADSRQGERWALDRGLLVRNRHGYGPARMPVEVALALRGPDWHAPFEPVPPAAELVAVAAGQVELETAAAATAFAAHTASVLSVCSSAPPARLKSGGVGARELGRIRKAAQAEDVVVRIVLETAYSVGLLARDGHRVAPTEKYDAWAAQEPAAQFATLLQAWWNLPLTPSQARDEDDKALPALAGAPPCDGCLQARNGLLTAAARLPEGLGVRVATDLGPLVEWHRPLAHPTVQDESPFATAVREAELLGVIARGSLSPLGAALLASNAEELAAECRRLLPEATSTARFGSDLTAVVSGTPAARLAELLDRTADRETSGTASVWRFSTSSIRQALDAGLTPDEVSAELAAIAEGPLPQPLSYLIADTARRHGRVRVAPAACVIHGDEPSLLAELAAHRGLNSLGLRQLAPTVLVSAGTPDQTLAALRNQGYGPVAEAVDGTVRIEKVPPRRVTAVPSPRKSSAKAGPGLPAHQAAEASTTVDTRALAALLLNAPPTAPDPDPLGTGVPFGTDTEEIVAGYAKQLTYADVRQLSHALDAGTAIRVEYVAASGSRTVRTLSRLALDPPYLEAWCHLREAERVFTLSRVHGVMPV
ncbi:helicase-associated domain-containing protein [Streptomyces sp. WMMC1477]|uniref:helicase-associated domain-containing protein n=1 Tax=Streptomyces sp. WMMC1477 TaxID=3015155 RepID=UPI0022B5EA72|nr:helicase-associated domain-containing protein [Streptomyces sp. WMMC1477]MCZ7432188.1 helicase-associated domain-containing protein [Streptomyces sp. WMMC1477]